MKHYGDVTKIKGDSVEMVDVITGGSPCQDLSIAGQRKGLAGERSGLFMEQIRIIKEMRNGCIRQLRSRGTAFDIRYISPRYMVWENVVGAFTSNSGEDFRAVLEETAKIAEPTAVIPRPKGGWKHSGAIMGNGWSIAWRVHDAQFWGTPQRRKRIALVADFNGETAPEVLFERKGMQGNTEQGGEKGQEIATDTRTGVKNANRTAYCIGNGQVNDAVGMEQEICKTLNCMSEPMKIAECYGADCYNMAVTGNKAMTLTASKADPQHIPSVICMNSKQQSMNVTEGCANTIGASDYKEPQCVCYDMDSERRSGVKGYYDVAPAITARAGTGGGNMPMVIEPPHKIILRKLTPLECERLQGYPDNWTAIGEWTDSKGKKRKDSDCARYKALGNSIALPFWEWLAGRICGNFDKPVKMASLFDGIGGFPLVFSRCGAEALWASEIEEFPMAVTKYRFK